MLNKEIKEKIKDIANYKYNDYELINNSTELQLINRIKEIYDERIVTIEL